MRSSGGVAGLGLRVTVLGLGFRVLGLGFWVLGLGFRVAQGRALEECRSQIFGDQQLALKGLSRISSSGFRTGCLI